MTNEIFNFPRHRAVLSHSRRKCSMSENNAHVATNTKMEAEESTYTAKRNVADADASASEMMIREELVPGAPLSTHLSFCKVSRLTTPILLLLQTFTKAYYQQKQQLLAQISQRKIFNSSLSRHQYLVLLLFLVISSNLPSASEAVGIYQQAKCETHGWNAHPVWKYRAKPRWVAPLRTDRQMQKEFLELFRGGYHGGDGSSSEEDSYEDFNLDPMLLQHIGNMCPKDAFFYSLNPRHLEAIVQVGRLFVAQPTPPDVLRLARALIKSPYVNPKVWYYAIIGASQERTDMTGFKLVHPIDAMPDLFIPGPMLFDVMDKYRSALERSDIPTNSTLVHRERRSAVYGAKRRVSRNGKNDTIADTFSTITIGKKNQVLKKKNVKPVKPSSNINPVKSSPQRQSTSTNVHHAEYEKGRTLLSSAIKKGARNLTKDRKKMSRKDKERKIEEDLSGLPGNITKYRADSSMWKRARIGAFDDCIVVDGSVGVHNGIENKLWYFREDMMVNQHHWYWHQEYPLNTTKHRPRRAELFFYMHRNLIARYNAERLSNGFPLVESFDIRRGALIPTGYDSLLADVNSGKFWTPRPPGTHLEDVFHMEDPDFERNILVGQFNELYDRLKRSVKVGHLLVGPLKTMNIRNTKGIEPLANTVEASTLTVNPAFYDAMGFHNTGHQLIGLQADPNYERKVPTGIMGDTLVTMRDPEFYTYHAIIDHLFDINKQSLPPYQLKGGQYPLKWEGVEILDIEVISKNGGTSPNQLRTFWGTRRFELAPGVDQSIHKGDLEVDVCAVHLNHEPFDFKITVALDPCAKSKTNKGSVRIFLAPRYDEHGRRFPLKQQRRLMVHMDTFPVDLRVGKNVIYRRSYDSNAVTPWTKHIKQYENPPKHPQSADMCGCGWPTHLYIPKGSPEGMQFDLFVMLTNYDHDYVEENPADLSIPEPCNSPYLYCGVKWRQYPDAKPMGYPFDRLPFSVPMKCPRIGAGPLWSQLLCQFLQLFLRRPVSSLEEYVSYAPNMASTIVEIKHLDHLVW